VDAARLVPVLTAIIRDRRRQTVHGDPRLSWQTDQRGAGERRLAAPPVETQAVVIDAGTSSSHDA
jgi:hypothetical protein